VLSVGYDVAYALHRMVAREAIRGPDRAVDRLVRCLVGGSQQAQIDPCSGHNLEFPCSRIGRAFSGLAASGTWMPELFIARLLAGPFPGSEG
jgi:hypothetical protein